MIAGIIIISLLVLYDLLVMWGCIKLEDDDKNGKRYYHDKRGDRGNKC